MWWETETEEAETVCVQLDFKYKLGCAELLLFLSPLSSDLSGDR